MSIDRMVLAFAGIVVMLGVTLAILASPWWILLTVFAGANMFQAAFTGFCPVARLFKAIGVRPGVAFS